MGECINYQFYFFYLVAGLAKERLDIATKERLDVESDRVVG